MGHEGSVTRYGGTDMQVCVPEGWDDATVVNWSNAAYPTGLSTGWSIRKTGNPLLGDDPERAPCDDQPTTHVHITLDC